MACTWAKCSIDVVTMDYLEAPFAADFFVVDSSLPRMSCDAEMSNSSSSLSDIERSVDPEVVIVSYYAKPAKTPTIKTRWMRERHIPLSSVQPLYDLGAKVTITHA